ncbi:MAG: class I SAM-dependent methyltransferase [Candidatus Pacearchaeota archaeon]|jgi:ubiquinone/menaquinone biosynthesis C-methylase UbiE
MGNYLETIYFTKEYGKQDYPQKLCNYIYERFFKKYAKKNKNQKLKLLDIGSGKGNHLVGFSRCGIESFGIDKRKECIEALNKFVIKECDIEKERLPFKDNTFDFVFSKSVLEHVVNTDNFLKETLRVLKPGGIAVMMTPCWRSQRAFFWDDYTHVKAFTRKSLQNAMKMNDFSNVNCECFLQLPFVWKYPHLEFLTYPFRLIPDRFKWRDKEESNPRKLIRFSKEKMLLAVGMKK